MHLCWFLKGSYSRKRIYSHKHDAAMVRLANANLHKLTQIGKDLNAWCTTNLGNSLLPFNFVPICSCRTGDYTNRLLPILLYNAPLFTLPNQPLFPEGWKEVQNPTDELRCLSLSSTRSRFARRSGVFVRSQLPIPTIALRASSIRPLLTNHLGLS